MIEISLTEITFGLQPVEDPSGNTVRRWTFHDAASGMAFHVPMNEDAMEVVRRLSAMTDAELQAYNEELRRRGPV